MERRLPSSQRAPTAGVPAGVVLGAVAVLAVALLGSVPRAEGAPADAGAGNDAGRVPTSITVTTTTRYVPYGWSHVVVLGSTCTKDATCTVSTDVNPEKQSALVPKGASIEVVTFLSSPSKTFTADVACVLR